MKRTLAAAFLVMGMIALSALWAFSQETGDSRSPDPPGYRAGSKMDSPDEARRARGTDIFLGGMGILEQLAGADIIHQRYQIRIQRVFLDAKEQTLNYREEQRILLDTLYELSGGYENDQITSKKEIIGILEKLRTNWRNIDTIHENSMEKIKALHTQRKKEIEKALDDEMKKLSTDNEEMKKFVRIMNQKQPEPR